jgi:hypothetical protein
VRVDTEPEANPPATIATPPAPQVPPGSTGDGLLLGLLRRAVLGALLAGAISLATSLRPRDDVDSIVLAWLCACADHPLRTAVALALLIGALGPAPVARRDER